MKAESLKGWLFSFLVLLFFSICGTWAPTLSAQTNSAEPGLSQGKNSQLENPLEDPNQKSDPPDQTTGGKSVDLSAVFTREEIPPYTYTPIDLRFWKTIEEFMAQNNYISLILEGAKHVDQLGEDTLDGGEGQLAMAKGFRGRKLYYAAFELLVRMAKERIGSSIGEAALYELSLLTQESAFDHEELNRLLIGNEFPRLHPDIDSFVSYYQAMDLLQLGFSDWAKVPLGRIRKGSYWDFLMQYWTAVGEVARGRIDRAIALFQGLTEEPGLPQPLFEKAALQYSRLVFEKGDFQTAFVIYNNLKIKGVREFGRIQLERAWVYYYLKDFGKAMGILTALQAPYFKPSLTFERHILEMIIYRDLCHYEAVEYVAQRFRENFKDSLIAIRNRQALRDDRVLFNLSVMNREVQEDANLIDQIRREGNLLKDYPWEGFSFYNPLLEGYARIDEILQARVGNQLEEKARAAANELLDAEEQVQFLEYTSRLDRLRIRRGTELKYLSQEISLVTFEKIFWPVDSEFWWDEIPDYNMNISSRCGDSGLSEENDLEKDFE